jgi:hypothetical protein
MQKFTALQVVNLQTMKFIIILKNCNRRVNCYGHSGIKNTWLMSKFEYKYWFDKKIQGFGILISINGRAIIERDFYCIEFKFLWFSAWLIIYKK